MRKEKAVFALLLILTVTWQQQLTLDGEADPTDPIIYQDQPSYDNTNDPITPVTPVVPVQSRPSSGPRKYNLISTGTAFLLPFKIGGLSYNLQIDSGSSDIFIKGEQTPGKPSIKYSCSACINNNPKYSLSYLDGGAAQTYETQLPVEFGGFSFSQSILVAYQATLLDDDEGIVGLSFAAAANNPNPTFLQTLINQNIISSYSYGLNINLQSKTSAHITLGSYDSSSFSGNLVYLPFSSQQECLVSIDGIRIGSYMLNSAVGLFDTGNTAISFQRIHQSSLLAAFKNQNNECFFHQDAAKFSKFSCKVGQMNELPRLTLSAQGRTFDLEKQAYLEQCYRNLNDDQIADNQGIWYCQTFIDVGDEKEIIIGDAFFSRYYTYFDLQNQRIGIAKNNENLSLSNVLSSESYDKTQWDQLLQSKNN